MRLKSAQFCGRFIPSLPAHLCVFSHSPGEISDCPLFFPSTHTEHFQTRGWLGLGFTVPHSLSRCRMSLSSSYLVPAPVTLSCTHLRLGHMIWSSPFPKNLWVKNTFVLWNWRVCLALQDLHHSSSSLDLKACSLPSGLHHNIYDCDVVIIL